MFDNIINLIKMYSKVIPKTYNKYNDSLLYIIKINNPTNNNINKVNYGNWNLKQILCI